ncbi:MAG: ribonuclease HII [Nanoarchaeota archaeon]|nr:ribonuclease HII [Nanoarchaeota archaeon]
MIICGIDEAGRGPVIGPMVMCGVAIEESDHYKLVQLGVKDSKLLSPRKRKTLSRKIRELTQWKVIQLSPAEVDQAVLSKGTNLNWLEAKTTALILKELKPDKAWIDCPSPNTKAYEARMVMELGGLDIDLVTENKADVNYPVVSAASIIAKVTRDNEIAAIERKLKLPIGSGYPADPITQKFLKDYGRKHPDIFRKSWQSWKRASQMKLGEF